MFFTLYVINRNNDLHFQAASKSGERSKAAPASSTTAAPTTTAAPQEDDEEELSAWEYARMRYIFVRRLGLLQRLMNM